MLLVPKCTYQLLIASHVAEWVRSYSSAEYLRLPAKAEALLDETGGALDFSACLLLRFTIALLCLVVHIVLCCIRSRNRKRRGLWCVAVHCQRPAFAGIRVCIQLKTGCRRHWCAPLFCDSLAALLCSKVSAAASSV